MLSIQFLRQLAIFWQCVSDSTGPVGGDWLPNTCSVVADSWVSRDCWGENQGLRAARGRLHRSLNLEMYVQRPVQAR